MATNKAPTACERCQKKVNDLVSVLCMGIRGYRLYRVCKEGVKVRVELKPEPAPAPPPEKPTHVHALKSYEVKACAIPALVGHRYTARTVENYIYLGKFPPGTRIYHPARGHLVVTADHKLIPEGEPQS